MKPQEHAYEIFGVSPQTLPRRHICPDFTSMLKLENQTDTGSIEVKIIIRIGERLT